MAIRSRALRVVLLGLSVVAIASCGSSTTPTESLTGTWSGSEIDTIAGTGTLTAIMTQNGSTLSGTYSLSFGNATFNNSGTLSGSLSGLNVTITATPSNPAVCPAIDTATVNSAGTQIVGNYAAVSSCAFVHQTGSFTATKQ